MAPVHRHGEVRQERIFGLARAVRPEQNNDVAPPGVYVYAACMCGRPPKILLTGVPGCGKTTAVRKIVQALEGVRLSGFTTEEIREAGVRCGFRWQRLNGPSGTLAHVSIKGRWRVGRYGVDVGGFDREVVSALDPDLSDAVVFVIDEIGKMECFSDRFLQAVRHLLASDRSVLATVALKGPGLIAEIKCDPQVELHHLTAANRETITQRVIARLGPLRGP
jgi:nucleoside-triphosphatase